MFIQGDNTNDVVLWHETSKVPDADAVVTEPTRDSTVPAVVAIAPGVLDKYASAFAAKAEVSIG